MALSDVFNFFSSKSNKVIGVELSPERITVTQVKRQGKTTRLAHFCTAEMPEGAMLEGRVTEPALVGQALTNLLAENKISPGAVATAIPGREAIVRLIRVKADAAEDELRRIVLEEEAELYIPYPRDQADIDFQPLGLELTPDGNSERMEVLLVASPKELVDNYIEPIRMANLQVRCVELNSFSLIRTIKDQLAQFSGQEGVVLTSIGYEGTEISIVVNGIPHFTRTVNIGTVHMQQLLGQALNLPAVRAKDLLQTLKLPVVSPTENMSMGERVSSNPGVAAIARVLTDLGDELRRSMDFYINQERSAPIAKILLAGSGAAIGQVDTYLSQRLSMPVELADPLSSINVPDSMEVALNQRPTMGVAVGLGLREL